jgi:hypothetical protein
MTSRPTVSAVTRAPPADRTPCAAHAPPARQRDGTPLRAILAETLRNGWIWLLAALLVVQSIRVGT